MIHYPIDYDSNHRLDATPAKEYMRMRGNPNDVICRRAFMRRLIAGLRTVLGGQIVVLLCVAAGCTVTPIQVEREDDLIDLLGMRAVHEELADVLARTYDPVAKSIQFKPDRLTITFSLESVDKTYLQGTQERLDLIYAQIEKLEPYTNGRVFVDHLGGTSTQLNFRHPDDAETFTKLFYALQSHAAS
jgi:hypothetical protein